MVLITNNLDMCNVYSARGSAVTTLVHRNRIQLDGMVEDPNFVVVFVLEYVLGEPVQAKDRRVGGSMHARRVASLHIERFSVRNRVKLLRGFLSETWET